MKHLLSKAALAVMAAASMVGCSNESELAMPEDASNAMRFSLTQRNSSRGTATTSTNYLDQIQGFQVWGHYTAGATGEGVTRISSSTFTDCINLESVILPSSLDKIGEGSFSGCTALTSVTLPSILTTIGNEAFYKCKKLTSVDIPEGVTEIGNETFAYCDALASITLPQGLSSIGNEAFRSCKALASITCKATSAPSLGGIVFYSVKETGSLIVPTGATGYDEWMKNDEGYLGNLNWTKVESSEL